ncbi:MAG TPA: carbon starvation protein A [Pirellulales bacterium]|jgi:carbon starvation protein|nr:carbon starvation protein A [Pirellulales bacterium]
MHAMPLVLIVLACLAISYRFYSAFLAAKVAVLDDSRVTPAHQFNDGQNYHPTHRWVLFGHHFAAISGAGPLIGPVLAIQFGYLPGLVWIVVGVCLAGAVQDMLVLAASVRRGGRSLAEIARAEVGSLAGSTASIAILFVVIIALSGLGVVVVKALGGEEIKLAAGTVFRIPAGTQPTLSSDAARHYARLPAGTRISYAGGTELERGEEITIARTRTNIADGDEASPFAPSTDGTLQIVEGTTQAVPGSSWGTFTIACTVPIALVVGLYMYKLRKGRVVEASAIGALAVLAVTVAGNWIPGSALEPYFQLTRNQTILAICAYGFIASVLPVWLLLCPRDYLSSFLKIGTVALLVMAVVVANPELKAPMVNELFAGGGGPYFNGAIFPFCFICIMCGAISGFHALVSSGTTPKMISKESDVRPIGYGAMLIEGLVGIMALIAAASLPPGDYWAINIDLSKVSNYAEKLEQMGAATDNLPQIERQVGGESLRGRTGGAVTLAVGMAQIFRDAFDRVAGGAVNLESVIKYWYHFAIMFEALFILTTIDTGTRIARFLLQEALGKIYPKFDRTDWLPGAVLSTAIVTIAWGGLIWTGSIDTIWPMFGIANQMLAVVALAVVTTVMVNAGRGRYAPLTVLPMVFVISTTLTAGYQMITGPFAAMLTDGWKYGGFHPRLVQGVLNIGFTLLVIGSMIIIVSQAVTRWLAQPTRRPEPAETVV